jgi:hypothetical protein
MPEGYISIIAAEVTDTLGESATNSQSNLFTFIPLTTGGGGGGSKPQNNTIIVTTPTPEPFMPQTPEALLGVLLIVSILAIAVIVGVAKSKTAQQLWSKRNMEANSW